MLRFAEPALFLLPFILYGLWLWLSNRVSAPLLLGGVVGMVVAIAGLLFWLGFARAIPQNDRYEPAQLNAGHVLAPKSVPGQ